MENRGLLVKSILFYLIICASLFLLQVVPASAMFIDFETYPSGIPTDHFDEVDTEFSSWGISDISSLEYIPGGGFDIVPALIRQDDLS